MQRRLQIFALTYMPRLLRLHADLLAPSPVSRDGSPMRLPRGGGLSGDIVGAMEIR